MQSAPSHLMSGCDSVIDPAVPVVDAESVLPHPASANVNVDTITNAIRFLKVLIEPPV